MKKINITIKQISNKKSIQNVNFGKNLILEKNGETIQNVNLNSILDNIKCDDRINVTIINKKQNSTKGEKNGK